MVTTKSTNNTNNTQHKQKYKNNKILNSEIFLILSRIFVATSKRNSLW